MTRIISEIPWSQRLLFVSVLNSNPPPPPRHWRYAMVEAGGRAKTSGEITPKSWFEKEVVECKNESSCKAVVEKKSLMMFTN